jgi:hypothetical protein
MFVILSLVAHLPKTQYNIQNNKQKAYVQKKWKYITEGMLRIERDGERGGDMWPDISSPPSKHRVMYSITSHLIFSFEKNDKSIVPKIMTVSTADNNIFKRSYIEAITVISLQSFWSSLSLSLS